MKLIGCITKFNPNGSGIPYEFYDKVFSKLSEIKHVKMPARHIGYECSFETDNHLSFLGFEVEKISALPDDFWFFELNDNSIKILAPNKVDENNMIESPVIWSWKNKLKTHEKYWNLGDFRFDFSKLYGINVSGTHEMWMNFNIFGNGVIEDDDRIEIVNYSPEWVNKFTDFKSYLIKTFPQEVLKRIEHIGSTSIPDLPAKPIIDLLIEVPDFSIARKRILPLLNDESWEYCWYNHHFMLIKRDKYKGKRTHHLHFVTKGHEQWRCISFRNYLRDNSTIAKEYSALKCKLAGEYRPDREKYTVEKTDFVQKITNEAIKKGY
jgi:GrpB-like predicted nucleotidyltransferase (UPF0157 family)